jgi:formylglycine-generating enzyme required for sulfatase activity
MSKAKNWAIVVGINKYAHIDHLDYANRDAEAMAAFFRDAGFDRVFCFADELAITPERDQKSTLPRSSDLVDFLHDRFTTTDAHGKHQPPLQAGDNCWFFFAGHGKRLEDRDCLLPQDYNPRIPEHEKRAIPVELVREALLKSGADNVILLLDACRTADDRDGNSGIGDAQPGAITIFSCERNQKAYEIEAIQHGAFTAALLEGLKMPKSAANCATVQRLDRHLRDRVPQLCQQYQKPIQNPNTTVDPGQKWYFLLLPKVATDQDIAVLKMEAFKTLQFEKNLDLAEELWIRVNAVAQGDDTDAVRALQDIAVQRALNPKVPTPKPATSSSTASRSTPPPPPEPPPATKQPTFSFDIITVDATGRETDRRSGTAPYFSENLGNSVILDMVQIPAGSFLMGADKGEEGASKDEYPQHSVTVPEFWMGKFVVTQAQWQAIANLPKVKIDLKPDPARFKGAKRPIEKVSWDDAIEFCDRLSRKTQKTYRLPNEAQWEYACRSGTTTPFHFGETITPNLVNYNGNYPYAKAQKGEYRKATIDVGSFPPNAFGLYDMHGNVWEWCMDTWHDSYDRAPNDGSAWIDKSAKTRLIRGGSWLNDPLSCRSAFRDHYAPANRNYDLGFRVICWPS